MNKMKEIAEMLGVELGEKFYVRRTTDGERYCGKFYFGDDGLLVRLPCKVGSTVYVIYCGYVTSAKVLAVYVDSVGGMFDLKIKTNKENSTGFETIINTDDYKFDDIGKTVFLTREEAEQALEELK